MNVKQTIHTLMYLPPRKSVLIESDHGLGKSQVVAQTAALMSKLTGKPFGLIDFRLAQCEVGDLIGMMRHEAKGKVTRITYVDGKKVETTVLAENVTIHSLADWFPQDPDSCGYLFLDELFRASRDLQNASMEIALDYRYHFKELPMGWRVIAASNDNMDVYAGTIPDPALYDRFLKIKFKPTIPEWLEYAEEYGVHKSIITYINKIPADLMPESKNIKPGECSPTPRAWVNLSDCIIYMGDQNQDPIKDENYFTLLCKGYLGKTVGVNFSEFVIKNFKIYLPQDILDKFDKSTELKQAFKEMLPAEGAYYTKEVAKHIGKLGKLTAKHSSNLFLWVKTMNKELAAGFWSNFIESDETRNIAQKWYTAEAGAQDYIFGLLAKEEALKKK